jgi:hypothetical protein
MKTFWEFLNDSNCISQSGALDRRRMTPLEFLYVSLLVNAFAVYTLVTGNLIGRRAPTIVNARHNSTEVYWIYAIIIIVAALLSEGVLWNAWRNFYRRRNA